MGSIPLPALAVQAPQQPDILSQLSKLQALKQMQGQQQIQQQTIQANQQEMQQRQQQMNDQQATTAALQEWDPKDVGALPGLIIKHGGSATAAFAAKKQILDQAQQISTTAKNDAETGKNNLETQTKRNDLLLGSLQQLNQVPDDQLSGALTAAAQDAVKQGLLDPAHMQQVQQFANYPPAQLRTALMGFEKSLQASSVQFEQGQKERETAATELKAQTESKRLQAEMPGGPLASPEKAEMTDWLRKNPGKTASDYKVWASKLAPQAQINVQGGPPSDQLVQAVATGAMKIGDVLTPRTPLPIRKQFLDAVLQANPQFKPSTFDIEKGVMKDFTSGPDAQKLQAFNTAITHMGVFKDMADQLDNGDVRVLNKAGNALGLQFGSDKSTNFNIAKQAFIGEVTRAFDGAGVTMHDREQVEQQISASSSPAQLKGAADTAEKLLRGKRDVLKSQFEQGSQGKPNFGDQTQGSDPFAAFGGKAKQ